MNKAYKYRIYPTKKQEEFFLRTFGCCRFIWNIMLADKIKYYQEHGTMLSNTPAMYKKEYPFLKEVDSLALANVQLNLQTAYKNFWNSPKTGFPKFKSKNHTRAAYTTNNQNGTIAVNAKSIKLPKIGEIKARIHRMAPESWKLKSATISMERDGSFYVSILYAYDDEIPTCIDTASAVGLDYKSDGLYMSSGGICPQMPHYYRKEQAKLARLQRQASRKQKGSKNREKANRKVAKVMRHVANQRKDFLHKQSREITNRYSVVCVETLDMRGMSKKGFGNGKATLDNGYGMFLQMLEYKQYEQGHLLVKVDKWYPSSKTCNCCGYIHHDLRLDQRSWICPACGTIHDRDYNAAINILQEGLRMLSA